MFFRSIKKKRVIVLVTASGSNTSEDFEHEAVGLNINIFFMPCGFLRDKISARKRFLPA